MGLFRKVVVAVLVLAILGFAGRQFGLINIGNEAIEKIDKSFGVNNFAFVPDAENFGAYEKKLGEVITMTDDEKNIAKAKLEVLAMQKSFLSFIEHRKNVDFEALACGPSTQAGAAKTYLNTAIGHGKAALELIGKIKSDKIGNTSTGFLKGFVEEELAEFEERLLAFNAC